MIDHCVAALFAQQEEKRYRAYITDALKALTENSARYMVPGGGEVIAGFTMAERWIDPKEKKEEPVDQRPAEEIAKSIWGRMRGE